MSTNKIWKSEKICAVNQEQEKQEAQQYRSKKLLKRDVRGVKRRLKQSALIYYLVALVYFFLIKGTPL
jgi:hypothetical protein